MQLPFAAPSGLIAREQNRKSTMKTAAFALVAWGTLANFHSMAQQSW
jgi:hypothetical protein